MVRLTRVSETVQKSSVPVDLAQLFEPIVPDLARVEQEFARQIDSQVELIPRIGHYIQTSGGKRVRPAVLLMAARLAGYSGDRAVTVAAVIEFIHTATLVHDDIIDDAEVRRGRRAVHSEWGNDITVLLGDYLYIKSIALAVTQDSVELIKILCDITLPMIEGEIYQLTMNGNLDMTEAEHFEIVRRKTAYLFGGCARIGGVLGALPAGDQETLFEYGFNLGIAFQLTDDLLDFTADQAVLGKPVGGDLREGKITLPIIYLLRRAGARARSLVEAVVRDRTLEPDAWRELEHLLTEYGATDAAYQQAVRYAETAKRHLSRFPPSRERDALMALPDYVLSRDR